MAMVWNAMLGKWMEEDGNPSTTTQAPGSNIGPGANSLGPQPMPQSSTQTTQSYANRSQEINAKNPNADPDKPYVQAGDTGGYLAGKGITIGEGRSITPQEAEAQKAAARAAGLSEAEIQDFLARNPGDTNRIQEAFANGGDGGSGGGSSVSQQWNSAGPSNANADAFYQQLLARSQQGLNVSRTDPAIRSQADAFSAQGERARREYLNDLAESTGPLANIRGEERLSAQRLGQASGAFEAQLMGQEVAARRDEIAQALQLMAGRLTAEQSMALERELAMLDAMLRREGFGLQREGMLLQDDQFRRRLGFDEWDRGNYWDYQWTMGV